jgi:hypothetical protein
LKLDHREEAATGKVSQERALQGTKSFLPPKQVASSGVEETKNEVAPLQVNGDIELPFAAKQSAERLTDKEGTRLWRPGSTVAA